MEMPIRRGVERWTSIPFIRHRPALGRQEHLSFSKGRVELGLASREIWNWKWINLGCVEKSALARKTLGGSS
jgi:hypothetical protein